MEKSKLPQRLALWTMEVDLDELRPGAITLLPHGLDHQRNQIPLLPVPLSMTWEQAQSLVDVLQEAIQDARATSENGGPMRQ